jgi:hypothetical protein
MTRLLLRDVFAIESTMTDSSIQIMIVSIWKRDPVCQAKMPNKSDARSRPRNLHDSISLSLHNRALKPFPNCSTPLTKSSFREPTSRISEIIATDLQILRTEDGLSLVFSRKLSCLRGTRNRDHTVLPCTPTRQNYCDGL